MGLRSSWQYNKLKWSKPHQIESQQSKTLKWQRDVATKLGSKYSVTVQFYSCYQHSCAQTGSTVCYGDGGWLEGLGGERGNISPYPLVSLSSFNGSPEAWASSEADTSPRRRRGQVGSLQWGWYPDTLFVQGATFSCLRCAPVLPQSSYLLSHSVYPADWLISVGLRFAAVTYGRFPTVCRGALQVKAKSKMLLRQGATSEAAQSLVNHQTQFQRCGFHSRASDGPKTDTEGLDS